MKERLDDSTSTMQLAAADERQNSDAAATAGDETGVSQASLDAESTESVSVDLTLLGLDHLLKLQLDLGNGLRHSQDALGTEPKLLFADECHFGDEAAKRIAKRVAAGLSEIF